MPVSLGVGDAETAVSQLQGALPAVRHARTRARGRERREGAAAPRQPHGCSGEGREREQQEGQEVRRRSREGRSGKKMPVSLGAGDAETAVSQPQGRRREGARTKRRSGSALPAVRLLGRRTGARATGGQEVCRRSREGQSGKTMPVSLGVGDAETVVSQLQGGPSCRASCKNACARKRTKRRSGSVSPAARLLGRRTGARAT